jgi:dihydroneopterin aldolase
MKNRININGIKIYAFHGCLEEEAKIGGNYTVDVSIETDFGTAAVTDELKDTIDYCQVYDLVVKEMKQRSKLIEHVCRRIHSTLKKDLNGIKTLTVKITKIAPPMNGDVQQVSVEITD